MQGKAPGNHEGKCQAIPEDIREEERRGQMFFYKGRKDSRKNFQAEKSYKFGSADYFGIFSFFLFLADCGLWFMIQVGFYAHQRFVQGD